MHDMDDNGHTQDVNATQEQEDVSNHGHDQGGSG